MREIAPRFSHSQQDVFSFSMRILGFLIAFCLVVRVRAEPRTDGEFSIVLQKWEKLEKGLKNLAGEGVKFLLPTIMEEMSTINISNSCARDTMMIIGGVRKIKTWAIRFVDASAKMMDGILSGTMSSMGAYDQCVETQVTDQKSGKSNGDVLFTGKYCFIDVKPPLPPKRNFYKLYEVLDELKNFSTRDTAIGYMSRYAQFFYFLTFRFAVCVPSSCSEGDINQLIGKVSDYLGVSVYVSRCEVKEEKNISTLMVAIMTAFAFAGFLMLLGTLIDLYSKYRERIFRSIGLKLLMAFSFVANFRKFVDTSTSSDTLSCLNGIRFLSLAWIILGHSYFFVNLQLFRGLDAVREWAKDFGFQTIVNGSVAVDTFFFIGGLLVCYLITKNCIISGKPFNVKLYIFHRIWRIVPVYFSVIALMFLSSLLGDGPIWHETADGYIQACYDNWWSNVIFINNFYNSENICILPSWYIACDMQLYIAALIILLPLLRWRKVGISIAIVTIFASIVSSGVITYLNDFPPAMLFDHPDPRQRMQYWAKLYFKPYAHAGPYCIGILSGYLLAARPNLKIPKVVQVVGWCLSIISCLSVLYGVLAWNRGANPNVWENMMYSSFNRTAWSLGVAWVVICCATGHGGVVNYFLSWKTWVPLGRLTFVAYLIHPIVQISFIGNLRSQIYPMHYFVVWIYCGHLMVTYGIAFAGSMLIEAPFLSIEKIIFPQSKKDNHSSQNGTIACERNGIKKVCSNLYLTNSAMIPTKVDTQGGLENNGFVCKL